MASLFLWLWTSPTLEFESKKRTPIFDVLLNLYFESDYFTIIF